MPYKNLDEARAWERRRYAANRDKIRIRRNATRAANLERFRNYQRKYESKLGREIVNGRARIRYNPEKEKLRILRRKTANPDYRKPICARYYLLHPEKMKSATAKWRAANPEKVIAIDRRFKRKNRIKIGKKRREKYWEDPQAARNKARPHCNKRRALKKSAPVGDIRLIARWDDSWRKKTKVKCYWCQGSFTPQICHADHIVALSKGGSHSIENLCISCRDCNLHKQARPLESWQKELVSPTLL